MESATTSSIAPGSAIEGINAPQALFGVLTQTIPAGGPVPATFLTTLNSFCTGIANPSNFNPLVSNVDYIPRNSPWSYVQNWFLSIQRELTKSTVVELAYNGNHSLNLPILADYNQAAPNAPGGTLHLSAAHADSDLRPDHLGRSGRQQSLQRTFGAPGASLLAAACTS